MTDAELANLVRIGELRAEPPARTEFLGLLRSADHRLRDAENTALNLESPFDLAYNAAHALALAALRWHGYRSQTRYLAFQCLTHTVGLDNAAWRILDQAHRKRNLAEYEGDVDVDVALVDALIRVAREVQQRVGNLEPPAAS